MTKKPIIALSEIPDTILALSIIVGIGAIFGLMVYATFEINKIRVLEARETTPSAEEYFGNSNIQIKYPQKNTLVKNPVSILGKADVYEGNVRIKISENKTILADTFLTADGFGKLYEFRGNVLYSFPSQPNGVIEIFGEDPTNDRDSDKVIIPVIFDDYSALIKWETYINKESGYSFEYPSNLTLASNSDNETVISHKVSYKHNNLCPENTNADSVLEDLTDLQFTISSSRKNIANSLKEIEGMAALSDPKISKTGRNGTDIYSVNNISNSCGTVDYFIELGKNHTIVIYRLNIPELKDNSELFAPLKDIFLSTKEEYIFDHILSSIKTVD